MNFLSYLEFDNTQHNLLAGLGWDQNAQGKGSFFRSHDDLDLCCCLMSKDYTLIDFITPTSPKTNEYRLEILHTGDHQTGEAPGEDEELHFNLKKLNADVCYVVFLVKAKKGTDFRKVQKPYCVFMDGSTYKNFLHVDVDPAKIDASYDAGENIQFVSAVLRRWVGQSLDGDDWTLLPVEKFIKAVDAEGADFFEVQEIVKELYAT